MMLSGSGNNLIRRHAILSLWSFFESLGIVFHYEGVVHCLGNSLGKYVISPTEAEFVRESKVHIFIICVNCISSLWYVAPDWHWQIDTEGRNEGTIQFLCRPLDITPQLNW